jgi:hypothetical protein
MDQQQKNDDSFNFGEPYPVVLDSHDENTVE